MDFLKRRAAAIAFLALAFFGGIAINQSAKNTARESANVVYHSQIRACHRSNELRREINRRVTETNVTKEVLISFLRSAEVVRIASFKVSGTHADKVAAKAYTELKNKENALQYHKVAIIDCQQVINKP